VLPLTPLMMNEWARAVVRVVFCSEYNTKYIPQFDGEASIHAPPVSEAFDPVKRRAALHPSRIASTSAQPASTTSELGHLSAIVSNILGLHQDRSAAPTTPPKKAPDPPSPAKPTPTKLARFLRYAQDNLGVNNATLYEIPLRQKGYGPDILHLVPDESLAETGLPHGDVIRLKAGCAAWFTSADAKRKRTEEDKTDDRPRTPPNKKVRYEKRFKDGSGAHTFWGPYLEPGDMFHPEWEIYYYCEARREYFPIPQGYCVIEDDENQDPFSFFSSVLNPRCGSVIFYIFSHNHGTRRVTMYIVHFNTNRLLCAIVLLYKSKRLGSQSGQTTTTQDLEFWNSVPLCKPL